MNVLADNSSDTGSQGAGKESDPQIISGQTPEDESLGLYLQTLPPSAQFLDPLEVRFSQMKMRHLFGDGRRVYDTVQEMKIVRATPAVKAETGADWKIVFPFPQIEVVRWHCKLRHEATGKAKVDPASGEEMYDSEEHWFTLDNRRLFCLQAVAMQVWPERAVVDVSVVLSGPSKAMRELRKFRTLDKGRSIAIGSQQNGVTFVRWSWRNKAGIETVREDENEFMELQVEGIPIVRRPKVDILEALSAVTPDSNERIQISKTISWVLRRGITQIGIPGFSDGWIRMTDLLAADCLKGISPEKLDFVIQDSNIQKFRYELKNDEVHGKLIRATGKKVADEILEPTKTTSTAAGTSVGNSGGRGRLLQTPPGIEVVQAAPRKGGQAVQHARPGSAHNLVTATPKLPFTGKGGGNRNPCASAVRGPVTPGAVGMGTAAASSASNAAASAYVPNGVIPSGVKVVQNSKPIKAKGAGRGASTAGSPSSAGTPSPAAGVTQANSQRTSTGQPRPHQQPQTQQHKNDEPMPLSQFMDLLQQVQARDLSSQAEIQARLQFQELVRMRSMWQQIQLMNSIQQARAIQEMEAMWSAAGMSMSTSWDAAFNGVNGFEKSTGVNVDLVDASDDPAWKDASEMTGEDIHNQIAKALQASQQRQGVAAETGPLQRLAAQQDPNMFKNPVGVREKPTEARSAVQLPANLEEKIQQTLQAAVQRGAARELEQQMEQQQNSSTSAAYFPATSPVERNSLEAKAAEALAAARKRNENQGAANVATASGTCVPRSAAPSPPTSAEDVQTKIAAALKAAKSRGASNGG